MLIKQIKIRMSEYRLNSTFIIHLIQIETIIN